jgi:predicted site-specific integrase-resolvase
VALRVERAAVWKAIKKGKIESIVMPNGMHRIPRTEVEKYRLEWAGNRSHEPRRVDESATNVVPQNAL